MIVEHGALVMAVDGANMALYRNAGRGFACELELICEGHQKNPPTAGMGSAAPGRAFSSTGRNRSSYDSTDLHTRSEEAFARKAAELLEEEARKAGRSVIMIAPPKTLGLVREHYGPTLKKMMVAEIDRDYAERPPADISQLLNATL